MMTPESQTNQYFFNSTEWDPVKVQGLLEDALRTSDGGELYLEHHESEGLMMDDGVIKSTSFNSSQGFGVRAIAGDLTGYAHSSTLTYDALKRALTAASGALKGYSGSVPIITPKTPKNSLYLSTNPIGESRFEDKIALLQEIDSYVRAKDPRVHQVTISLASTFQGITIMSPSGKRVDDLRPLVRISVSVVVKSGDRLESGSSGGGGRSSFLKWNQKESWKVFADDAVEQALINLDSVSAPAGEMPVVLGPGWPGILLHEAIGHGLEADFNRKGTSAFSNLMGQRVAAPGVTVVDDGTISDRRGSLNVDDEGNPTERTVLIEDGILKGNIQDSMNANLMKKALTGNGRRESYAHAPLPRMTNTFMMNGTTNPEDIIASVKNGIYAVNFGSGQVDITSGKFVFSASLAYKIEDGKISHPVKGATIIGNGADALTKISMIGNDMKLDSGIGTCMKDGQGVPVGVGQPTLLMSGLTVGGTQV